MHDCLVRRSQRLPPAAFAISHILQSIYGVGADLSQIRMGRLGDCFAAVRRMPAKHIVYLLRSLSEPKRPYIGLTHDVDARLAAHNAGRCAHTARYRPWGLVAAIMLADEPSAIRFERYLKSGSGRAFAKRHFES